MTPAYLSTPAAARLLRGPVLDVARRLLGAVVEADGPDGTVGVRLTEVEAYAGPDDPASHAFRGRTPRTTVMFGPPGRLYVYFSYGMHHCANVVCGPDGVASAVLLRAGEVVGGHELARGRRASTVKDSALARGPALLTRCLGLSVADTGVDLLDPASPVRLGIPAAAGAGPVLAGPRVGVSVAADRPWRFRYADDPTVSAYRRSPRAPAPSHPNPVEGGTGVPAE